MLHSVESFFSFSTPFERIFPELEMDTTDTHLRQRETHTDKEKEIVDAGLLHIDTCRESRLEIVQFFKTVDGFELSVEVDFFDIRTKGIIRDKGTDRNIDNRIGFGTLFFSGLDFFDFLFEEFEVETHTHIFGLS